MVNSSAPWARLTPSPAVISGRMLTTIKPLVPTTKFPVASRTRASGDAGTGWPLPDPAAPAPMPACPLAGQGFGAAPDWLTRSAPAGARVWASCGLTGSSIFLHPSAAGLSRISYAYW